MDNRGDEERLMYWQPPSNHQQGDSNGNNGLFYHTTAASQIGNGGMRLSPELTRQLVHERFVREELRALQLGENSRQAAIRQSRSNLVYSNPFQIGHRDVRMRSSTQEDHIARLHSVNPYSVLVDQEFGLQQYDPNLSEPRRGSLDSSTTMDYSSVIFSYQGDALTASRLGGRVSLDMYGTSYPDQHLASQAMGSPFVLSTKPTTPTRNSRHIGASYYEHKKMMYLGSNGNSKGHVTMHPSRQSDSLMELKRSICNLGKDQNVCLFLQRKFDEGKPQELEKIFNKIIDHVGELMVSPSGNYLMQKLLDICTEEQRMRIICTLTKDPAELIRISLDNHGTRAVQKLIETLKTDEQIALVISALEPGFFYLVKSSNGNHVIQRCLQYFSSEDNKFIFDAAIMYCFGIATHRHGCCVLQRCIDYSSGKCRDSIVAAIYANGLSLAQDAYGNYVIQYILNRKEPVATASLASQFQGRYVSLSTQKFSSNVVEKCLKVFGNGRRAGIIYELLEAPHFERLLQDPFANYVILSALENSKGSLHDALVESIRPHAAALRDNIYCKRIFSKIE
ncbi:putative pumilio homolog 8, chloroplastic [Typha angustifolia]|uniref:putative pumilio homolog 8, chloroplastic n=1 Tax=Typha angustifolia TaxID=59011 RepID=UPI003C304C81